MTQFYARRYWLIAIAGCIVVFAFVLRVYQLGEQELWLDEVFSVHTALLHERLAEVLRREDSPPFYYLLLRFWLPLAGTSEAAVRFPSAIAGTLCVLAVMWAGWQVFTPAVGLWAGGFAAVAPIHIYYSQEARTYALLTLELALTYGLLWRAMRFNTWTSWALVSGTALTALYSHYFAVLGLLPTFFILKVWLPGAATPLHRRRFLVATLFCLVLYLPWIIWAFVINSHAHTLTRAGNHWLSTDSKSMPAALAIPRSFEMLALGPQANSIPIYPKQFASLMFPDSMRTLGIVVLAGLFLWVVVPWKDSGLKLSCLGRRKAWVASLVAIPLLILWLVSFSHPIYFVGRYDMVAFPGYALLLGVALAKLQAVGRFGKTLAVLGALGLLTPIGTKLALYYEAPAVTWAKRTADAVDLFAENGDAVVFDAWTGRVVLGYYLPRLNYDWEDGVCRNARTARQFICRIFPAETEETFIYLPDQVLKSPDLVRSETREVLQPIALSNGHLLLVLQWSTFADGVLLPVPPMDLFVSELVRPGFRPRPVPTEGTAGIYRFERS